MEILIIILLRNIYFQMILKLKFVSLELFWDDIFPLVIWCIGDEEDGTILCLAYDEDAFFDAKKAAAVFCCDVLPMGPWCAIIYFGSNWAAAAPAPEDIRCMFIFVVYALSKLDNILFPLSTPSIKGRFRPFGSAMASFAQSLMLILDNDFENFGKITWHQKPLFTGTKPIT